MNMTIEESQEWEKPLLNKDGSRRNLHKIWLVRDEKRVCSLYHYIVRNFNRIKQTLDKLMILAKERHGPEGWRLVSFEGIGLFLAHQNNLLLEGKVVPEQ